ncbi:hypothetical protein BLNAU_12294 [Blattamonas nauphoetae]|uniref:Uncharacterized protein n=1 Tax=Blattamonas nauphoetae TaxID=2049346 RepID=A0ABQ9XR50_9EUKA|nr:hypothetical protein BLNAU_12294 [Blattamonas nauphoetae]
MTRPYSQGALVGNWFEDYSQTNRQMGTLTSLPGFRTTYQEQTAQIAQQNYSATDRNFIHEPPPPPLPQSEMRDAYRPPTQQKTREFRSTKIMNKNKFDIDAYRARWTQGKTGETQDQKEYRNFYETN